VVVHVGVIIANEKFLPPCQPAFACGGFVRRAKAGWHGRQ